MILSPTGLRRWIQRGLLALVALMPFHAFLSVWLGHLTGHEAIIQAWKEALLVILALATGWLVWREPGRLERLRQPWVALIGAFAIVAALVTLVAHPGLKAAAFGAKTDFEFLLAAIIATVVADTQFLHHLKIVILVGASGVIGFGLLQIFVLPPDFLVHFGYGPNTILPYQHITVGTDALRFPSTLGGPNQLGTYLILPLALSVSLALRRQRWWPLGLTAAGLIVLFATYSRSAWIGAATAIVIVVVALTPLRLRRPLVIGLGGLAIVAALALPAILMHGGSLQYYLLHSSLATHDQTNSDTQHAASLATGIRALAGNPLGHGLGTAGPSTFHAGTTNIIENYYLQIGFETGLLGLLAFATLMLATLRTIWRHLAYEPLALPIAAALIGVSLVALVLPAWTDSSTALIAWIATGAVVGASGSRPSRRHPGDWHV